MMNRRWAPAPVYAFRHPPSFLLPSHLSHSQPTTISMFVLLFQGVFGSMPTHRFFPHVGRQDRPLASPPTLGAKFGSTRFALPHDTRRSFVFIFVTIVGDTERTDERQQEKEKDEEIAEKGGGQTIQSGNEDGRSCYRCGLRARLQ